MNSRPSRRKAGLDMAAVAMGVGAAHLVLFGLLGHLRPAVAPTPFSRPVEVELVRPSPIPPPSDPPPSKPAPSTGGGAPAAPSRVHESSRKNERPPELSAPAMPAPEPSLVVGVAPISSPAPGLGAGGEGTGSGEGVGAGAGPGAGDGPPRLLQGPSREQLRQLHPREAFRQRLNGHASLACRIRLDTRLEACRLVDETPPGRGFGAAALAASVHFRFRPPTRDGRPVEGREITVGVEFGP